MPDEGDGEPVVDDSTPSENEDLQPVEEDTSLDANGDGVDDFEFVWNDDFSDGQPPDGNAAGDGSGTGSTATGSAAAGEQMVSYSIEVHKNGTSYVYSQTLAGGSATFTDASGGVTAMVYDGKGSLTSLTDPVSNLTSFTYDSAGNMLSETNAQGTRSYVYDGQNRLVSSVDRNERIPRQAHRVRQSAYQRPPQA